MEEAGEKLKFVKRGGANVLVTSASEGPDEQDDRKQTENVGKRSEGSVLFKHPKLFALMTVLGAGVSSYLLQNNESIFNAEGSGSDVRTVAEVENIAEQNLLEFPKPFEEAYTGFLPGEKEEALSFVIENGVAMENNLGPEQIEKVMQYKSLVEESVQGTHVPADLLLGLIAAESLGDRFVRSYAGDYLGLTQMSAEIASKQGLENIAGDENDDRFVPEKIIPATVKELEEYWGRYQDLGLMFGAWHMGTKNMYKLIQEYVEDAYGRRLPDIETDDYAEAGRRMDLYRNEIAGIKVIEVPEGGPHKEIKIHPGINMWRLFDNRNIAEITEGSEWDKTREYVPRIVTAAQVLDNSGRVGETLKQ